MKVRTYIFLLLILFSVVSCGGISDYTKELPGGYEFVSESKSDQLIHGNNILIPCTVSSFSYNKNFIVAAQLPAKTCIQANSVEVIAPIQFWIIIIQEKKLLGPLTLAEFIKMKNKLEFEENLKLKITI